METFTLIEGTSPLLVSIPHCGLEIPAEILARMAEVASELADTDWHVDSLYDFAPGLGASVIRPHASRYVIDLNRPPDNAELYPGANGTELCPTSTFSEQPLYLDGNDPNGAEIQRRLQNYWHPYHRALQAELQRIHSVHGCVILFEAHSIRSLVPRLFEGQLPDLNVGTAQGGSCSPALQAVVEDCLASQQRYSHVTNKRFKGGYITRAYGRPPEGVHAVQLELSQRNYMEEELPFTYLPEQAALLQPLLRQLLQGLIDWALEEGRQQ
jgi:N-formylglutamate deformylase